MPQSIRFALSRPRVGLTPPEGERGKLGRREGAGGARTRLPAHRGRRGRARGGHTHEVAHRLNQHLPPPSPPTPPNIKSVAQLSPGPGRLAAAEGLCCFGDTVKQPARLLSTARRSKMDSESSESSQTESRRPRNRGQLRFRAEANSPNYLGG